MKKLIVGLLAAFLMTTGLVAFSGAPASAAKCPYSGCVNTTTVGVAIPGRGLVRIKAKVVANGSSKKPSGRVFLRVSKIKKNGNLRTVTVVSARLNRQAKARFTIPNLKKGKYKYALAYANNEAKGFNNSSAKGRFTIK